MQVTAKTWVYTKGGSCLTDLDTPFQPLVERILTEASVVDDRILKIDHFLNHQIEPAFMQAMGQALAERLEVFKPDRILTAEASGIAPGLAVAQILNLPLVFAKKYAPEVELPAFSRIVPSATKGTSYRLVISRRFLPAGQRIALVDDFLANGGTALALVDMVAEAQSTLVAAGFLVEKVFQGGRAGLVERGIPVATLAQVAGLHNGKVIMSTVAS
jgi:xanthine phosphoribosyltransferase